jgi:hypothetical protein
MADDPGRHEGIGGCGRRIPAYQTKSQRNRCRNSSLHILAPSQHANVFAKWAFAGNRCALSHAISYRPLRFVLAGSDPTSRCDITARQASLKPTVFAFRHATIRSTSGISLLQSRKHVRGAGSPLFVGTSIYTLGASDGGYR